MADRRTPTAPDEASENTIDDLSVMVKRLANALQKADPTSELPAKAHDLLLRKGIRISNHFRR